MPITPTVRHLYAAAKNVGYTGPNDNPDLMKSFCDNLKTDGKPDPLLTFQMEDGTEVVIKDLAFETPEPRVRRRSVRVVLNGDHDDGDAKADAMVQAAVDDRLKSMGLDPNRSKRMPNLASDVEVGESGEERMYNARIATGRAAFKSYGIALGFGAQIKMDYLRAVGKTQQAEDLYKSVRGQLDNRNIRIAKGYNLTTNAAGGALVPDGYDADLWQLVLTHGVARRSARVVPMSSETLTRPKATGTLTVRYPAQEGTPTQSTKTFSNVNMVAKEGVVLTQATKALMEDSAINIADDAGQDIARAIAYTEDNTLFNSDGSGETNGYIPQTQGILNIVSETSTGSRVYKSSATTPLGVTLSDVIALMSTPGAFAGRRMAFHCTPQIGAAIFQRLLGSAGGATPDQLRSLGADGMFLGVPVFYNNVMTTNLGTGSNRQLAVYADMSLVADFGDRKGVTIEISEQVYWASNSVGIKGTVRHDINVHGLGTSSTTGPCAVLIQT